MTSVVVVSGTLIHAGDRRPGSCYACRAGLATLLGEYPVLARLMGQACASAVDAQLELLRRFAADRDAIVTALLGAVDPGQLVAVEHCGDLHQGGRSTALLRFAGGAQVAYKPRPLGVHAHFNTIVRWLNGKVAQRYPPGEPAPRGRAMGALAAMRTHACSSPVDGASSDGVDGASGDRVDGASSRSTAGTRSGYASRSSPWPIPAYPVSSPGVPTMPGVPQ